MWNFKLPPNYVFFRDMNPSSCKCSGLIWLMRIFPSWNFGFCNTTEKLLFIPPPAKASVIQPSHMHTTSSRCWSLAKIILCFSIAQHSGELCQHGIMPACAPLFSHFPVPWEAAPGTSFLTCSPFPGTSPSTLPAAWLPCADVALQAQSHALLTIPKSECCSSNLTATRAEVWHVWDSVVLWHGVKIRPLWRQDPFEFQL